jgi:hypothetical protein
MYALSRRSSLAGGSARNATSQPGCVSFRIRAIGVVSTTSPIRRSWMIRKRFCIEATMTKAPGHTDACRLRRAAIIPADPAVRTSGSTHPETNTPAPPLRLRLSWPFMLPQPAAAPRELQAQTQSVVQQPAVQAGPLPYSVDRIKRLLTAKPEPSQGTQPRPADVQAAGQGRHVDIAAKKAVPL